MEHRTAAPSTASQANLILSPAGRASTLRRQCSCGNHSKGRDCENCTNKKLQRKLSPSASRLTPGASNDPLEQEADRVAEQVLASESAGFLSRPAVAIQRHAEQASDASDSVPQSVDRVLNGTGSSLPRPVQKDMEARFGQSFSQVRIHMGEAAARSARDVQASAYTLGNHIVFNSGKFAPSTTEGKRLLAHELTHVVQQSGAASRTIARAPDPNAPKSNFTPEQQALLEQARVNQKADGTRIVGVLLVQGHKPYELISGGQGRFYAHIEGKAVALMNELKIQRGVLLVEKEPCQTCDRSVYTYDPLKPAEGGPEVPLLSSKTGKPLAREPSMINTGLHKGSVLKVIDPVSSGIYYGLKTPPKIAGSEPLPPVGPAGTPSGNPSAAPNAMPKDAPTDVAAPGNSTPQVPAAKTPIVPPAQAKPPAPTAPLAKPPVTQPSAPNASDPKAPAVSAPKVAAPAVAAPTAAAPAKPSAPTAPTAAAPAKPSAPTAPTAAAPAKPSAPTAPSAAVPAKPSAPTAPAAAKPVTTGERQQLSVGIPSASPPAAIDTSKGQAKGHAAVLAVQGVLAILAYFADKHQRSRADAAWAEAYPRIQDEVTRTGRGVVVYVEYTQNQGSPVLIFEGIHWSSGGQDSGRPGSLRAPGQSAVFSRSYVGATEAQAAISDETALIFRRDEARTRQRDLQKLTEVLAREGRIGRYLRERAGDSIDPVRAYDAKAHIASASQSITDKRYSDAAASLAKADAALDEMWAQIEAYVGEKKLKELRDEG